MCDLPALTGATRLQHLVVLWGGLVEVPHEEAVVAVSLPLVLSDYPDIVVANQSIASAGVGIPTRFLICINERVLGDVPPSSCQEVTVFLHLQEWHMKVQHSLWRCL